MGGDDDDLGNYAAGVGIALASTACSALGLLFQKLAHRSQQAHADKLAALDALEPAEPNCRQPHARVPTRRRRWYWLRPLWLGGVLCMLVGALMSFAVFNFLGQSRASAMASVTIVWNGILSALILKERFSSWDALSSATIVCGAIVAVVFGSAGASSMPTTDLDSVVRELSRQIVWIAALVIIVAWFGMYAAARYLEWRGRAHAAEDAVARGAATAAAAIHPAVTATAATASVISVAEAQILGHPATVFSATMRGIPDTECLSPNSAAARTRQSGAAAPGGIAAGIGARSVLNETSEGFSANRRLQVAGPATLGALIISAPHPTTAAVGAIVDLDTTPSVVTASSTVPTDAAAAAPRGLGASPLPPKLAVRTALRLECYLRIALSGILTGLTGMLASGVVKSISGAVALGSAGAAALLSRGEFYGLLLPLPVSLVGQLMFLNSALAKMDSLEIVPPYQASVILVGIAWGMVFTSDASGMPADDLALFVLGCGISCVGVLLLAFKTRLGWRLDALLRHAGLCVRCLGEPSHPLHPLSFSAGTQLTTMAPGLNHTPSDVSAGSARSASTADGSLHPATAGVRIAVAPAAAPASSPSRCPSPHSAASPSKARGGGGVLAVALATPPRAAPSPPKASVCTDLAAASGPATAWGPSSSKSPRRK